jgi:hypothetical protein
MVAAFTTLLEFKCNLYEILETLREVAFPKFQMFLNSKKQFMVFLCCELLEKVHVSLPVLLYDTV